MSITKTEFIAAFLQCGTADVDFALTTFEKFDVDMYDVLNTMTDSESDLRNFNDLIATIFYLSIENSLDEMGRCYFPKDIDERFEIFTNFIDSHIIGTNTNGESITINCKDELIEFLQTMTI